MRKEKESDMFCGICGGKMMVYAWEEFTGYDIHSGDKKYERGLQFYCPKRDLLFFKHSWADTGHYESTSLDNESPHGELYEELTASK